MKVLLPKEFWKLSFLWFFNASSRVPEAKRGLFRNSLMVASISFAIGIAALSITLQLTSGFEDTLGRAVQGASGHLVHPTGRWMTFGQLENFVKLAPEGILRAQFFWNSQGLIVGKTAGRGVLIEGSRLAAPSGARQQTEHVGGQDVLKRPDGDPNKVDQSRDSHARNSDQPKSGPNSLVAAADVPSGQNAVRITLGTPLAKILGVKEDDQVRLLLPGILKGSVLARVERLVNHGIFELDSRFARVDDRSLRNYLEKMDPDILADRPGDAHGIRFFLDPKIFSPKDEKGLTEWISTYKKNLKEKLQEDSVDEIFSWRDGRSNLFRQIEHDKGQLSIVIGLLSFVSALNIAATLVVLFLMRDRDIAILQALGLGPRGVFQWILIQGAILGVFSSALGIVLGQIFGFVLLRAPFAKIPEDIYNIGVLPLKFVPGEQLSVFLFGVGAALFFAFILATGLARINLVRVLGFRR